MKRAFLILLTALLIVSLCACNQTTIDPTTETPPQTAATIGSEFVATQKPMAAVSLPFENDLRSADDGTVIFQYTHQNMRLILPDPEVADMVILDFLNRIDAHYSEAEAIYDTASAAYNGSATWIPYLYSILYEPERIDQTVLSLSGSVRSYAGGAHPSHNCISANYDLTNGQVLTLGSILHHIDALEDLKALSLNELDKIAKEQFLFEDYRELAQQRFAKDESYDEDWYFTDTGLCFYFSPYEIAPYASGVITIEIPYSSLSGILADAYFPPETQSTSGVVNAVSFEEANMSSFTQIAELILDNGGTKKLLYCEDIVEKVYLSAYNDITGEVYKVFASQYLSPGDAIMIEASEISHAGLSLQYTSGDKTVNVVQ